MPSSPTRPRTRRQLKLLAAALQREAAQVGGGVLRLRGAAAAARGEATARGVGSTHTAAGERKQKSVHFLLRVAAGARLVCELDVALALGAARLHLSHRHAQRGGLLHPRQQRARAAGRVLLEQLARAACAGGGE